jgi:putative PIN family toxin of toxin-antitoxin system
LKIGTAGWLLKRNPNPDIACDIIELGGAVRLVLDTDVLVAALRSDKGASRQLVVLALDRKIELLVSVPLMVEYEAVLTRPAHLTASGLSAAEVNEILDGMAGVITPVRLRFLWRPKLNDPADEMVLETAVNGGADSLVTFNIRHLAVAAREFGIRVIRPPDALKEYRDNAEE